MIDTRPGTPGEAASSGAWLGRAGWLGGGSIASLGCSALAGILLARFLSPSGLGTYAAVTVGTSLLGTLTVYGLDLHLVTVLRNLGSDRRRYATVFHAAMALSLTASVIAEVVVLLVFSAPTRLPLMIDIGEVALAPVVLRAVVLQVRGEQRSIVFAQMINRVTWIAIVLFVVIGRLSNPLPWLMGGRVAIVCLQGAALTALARFPRDNDGLDLPLGSKLGASLRSLRDAAPLAFASIFGTSYNRLDQLILVAFRGSYATGLYAGGVRLAELPGAIPAIAQNVSLPSLIQVREAGRPDEMSRALNDALLLTIIPGGLAVAVIAGLGRSLVVLVLGQRFAGATTIVIILAAADWARLPATVYASMALASGRRRVLATATGCALGVNIITNVALIPFIGAPAAAIASLLAYWISAVLTGRGALRGAGLSPLSYVLPVRLGLASAAAALIGHANGLFKVRALPLPADAALIVTVYVLAVWMFLPGTERRHLRDIRGLRRNADLATRS